MELSNEIAQGSFRNSRNRQSPENSWYLQLFFRKIKFFGFRKDDREAFLRQVMSFLVICMTIPVDEHNSNFSTGKYCETNLNFRFYQSFIVVKTWYMDGYIRIISNSPIAISHVYILLGEMIRQTHETMS